MLGLSLLCVVTTTLMPLSGFCLCPLSRLLVGAPKEKANGLKDVNETGAVYACPISTTFDDCSRMDLVTQRKFAANLFVHTCIEQLKV